MKNDKASFELSLEIAELIKQKNLTISPEVAKLAGSLKPYIGLSDDEIDEEELTFLKAIKEDDERIKSYGI